jgi:hypothetical protein
MEASVCGATLCCLRTSADRALFTWKLRGRFPWRGVAAVSISGRQPRGKKVGIQASRGGSVSPPARRKRGRTFVAGASPRAASARSIRWPGLPFTGSLAILRMTVRVSVDVSSAMSATVASVMTGASSVHCSSCAMHHAFALHDPGPVGGKRLPGIRLCLRQLPPVGSPVIAQVVDGLHAGLAECALDRCVGFPAAAPAATPAT